MATNNHQLTHRDCVLDDHFREDLEYWVQQERKTALRVGKLMEVVLRDPFSRIGKPERLRHLDADYPRTPCATIMIRNVASILNFSIGEGGLSAFE